MVRLSEMEKRLKATSYQSSSLALVLIFNLSLGLGIRVFGSAATLELFFVATLHTPPTYYLQVSIWKGVWQVTEIITLRRFFGELQYQRSRSELGRGSNLIPPTDALDYVTPRIKRGLPEEFACNCPA